MPKIEVVSQIPAPKAGSITAWIELDPKDPLATSEQLEAHAGWSDYQARREAGSIGSPYLTGSNPGLLYLPGSAAKHWTDGEKVKTLAAKAYGTAQERRSPLLVVLLDAADSEDIAAQVAEGISLFAYTFTKYRTKPKEKEAEPTVKIVVAPRLQAAAKAAVKARIELCESVNRARDLVNEPAMTANPDEVEARARKVAKAGGLKITVLDQKQLAKEGYEGLIGVGKGAAVPPRMIVLSYNPAKGKKGVHLGLLGKGVCFDTGGISIKPSSKMWEMKGDMGGAAAVLYAMEAIARVKPKVRVTGIIVTCINAVDANAILPGDIITARNGKSIHVDNTDAEGRLILTDGFWRMGEEKVTHLVDAATLTGAIVRALGTGLSGSFGNDEFVDDVTELAGEQGEPCWKMPMVEEYLDMLKCDVADINNVSGKAEGSAIQAALFLREFVPPGISWTHLDIAGTFLVNSTYKYLRAGGTGVMVKTLTALAEKMAG